MWSLPAVGISILVEDLLMLRQSSLCLISRFPFVKPYRQRSQKYACFGHRVTYSNF